MLRLVLLFVVIVLYSAPVLAKFFDLQREAVINTRATKVALRCGNARSLFRICFPHISKSQCQSTMKVILPRCKEEIFRFARKIGKTSEHEASQRKIISSLTEGCIIAKYRDRLMRNQSKTMACMNKVRH